MTTAQTVRVLWKPNPGPQTAFLACPVREILYGGAKGGGKTDAIGPKALKHIEMYGEWACVLILRQSYPMLKEIMKRMRPLCLAAGGRYNKTDKTWTFPSGATIIFGHTTDGCDPYWGQEYSLIIIDEVTRTIQTKEDYDMLLGSLRNSHGVPCSVILTSNPGGIGHNWVKERFLNVPPMAVQVDPVTGFERVFIPAGLKDNPKLGPEYRLQLEQMNDKERRAYLHGDWNAFEGSVFNLEKGIHTWTWAQFKERTGQDGIPKNWHRFRVMDWGYAKPFAVYWIAVDYEGRGYVYREWYGCATDSKGAIKANVGLQMEPTTAGARIADLERGEKIAAGWTGPDLFSAGTGDTSAGIKRSEYFARQGVHFVAWEAGPDSRKAKKAALHERLAYKLADDGTVAEWPGLIFIDSETPHAQRTIPALEYDPKRGGEDVDTTGEDHAYDAIAAFCLMRPWAPREKDKTPQWKRAGRRRGAVGL